MFKEIIVKRGLKLSTGLVFFLRFHFRWEGSSFVSSTVKKYTLHPQEQVITLIQTKLY